jgi:hypothetical protein
MDSLIPGRGVSSVKYDAEFLRMITKMRAGRLVMRVKRVAGTACITAMRARNGRGCRGSLTRCIVDKEEAGEAVHRCDRKRRSNIQAGEGDDDEKAKADENQGERKTACVYQIWDKRWRASKVRYVSSHYPEGYLKVEDDPLGHHRLLQSARDRWNSSRKPMI